MDDRLYNQILHFFISNENKYPGEIYKLPPEKRVNAKSQFRQTVKPYTLKDGVLMHTEKQLLRESGVDAVLKMCHDNPVTVVIFVVTKPIRRSHQDSTGKVNIY